MNIHAHKFLYKKDSYSIIYLQNNFSFFIRGIICIVFVFLLPLYKINTNICRINIATDLMINWPLLGTDIESSQIATDTFDDNESSITSVSQECVHFMQIFCFSSLAYSSPFLLFLPLFFFFLPFHLFSWKRNFLHLWKNRCKMIPVRSVDGNRKGGCRFTAARISSGGPKYPLTG